MYRQILVHPDDRDLQRILWRHNAANEVREYRLNTVTYGLACAPFLAIRTLHQLASDEQDRYPRGAAALKRDCYVDDVMTGASNIRDAGILQKQLRKLCTAGGFPLRKWAANNKELLEGIPLDHRLQQDALTWEPECHSTLGLRWHPAEDCFSIKITAREITHFTKRLVLAETARLFDPLGWFAPVVIRAKILIQSAWIQRLEWDAPLPSTDACEWQAFFKELPLLQNVRIRRWLGSDTRDVHVKIHGFSDASERGFAAVVYLRTTDVHGDSRAHLLMAKTKVAPAKPVSLPRLEFCAAALLVTLMHHIQKTLELAMVPTHLWCDSTVTLHWIRGHLSRWKTYVANRVSHIQQRLPEAKWHHVPGKDNPANCASRGISPHEMQDHSLWWMGPPWLHKPASSWPNNTLAEPNGSLLKLRATAHPATVDAITEPELLLQFSSWTRLLRVTAWCLRWRSTNAWRDKQSLHADELKNAARTWFRTLQRLHYAAEITALTNRRPIPHRSQLSQLRPFLDPDGTLRVGGRLEHSRLPYDERHTSIAPPASWLTCLLVESCYRYTLHGGVQLTLGAIRQTHWIPRKRTTVKSVLHRWQYLRAMAGGNSSTTDE